MAASIAIALAAAAMALVGFRNAGWIGRRRRIQRIVWQADGRWCLIEGAGQQVEAVLRGDSRVAAAHAWLHWDVQPPQRGSRTVLLVPGDVSEPDLRRLAVRLRIDQPGRAAPPAMAPNP